MVNCAKKYAPIVVSQQTFFRRLHVDVLLFLRSVERAEKFELPGIVVGRIATIKKLKLIVGQKRIAGFVHLEHLQACARLDLTRLASSSLSNLLVGVHLVEALESFDSLGRRLAEALGHVVFGHVERAAAIVAHLFAKSLQDERRLVAPAAILFSFYFLEIRLHLRNSRASLACSPSQVLEFSRLHPQPQEYNSTKDLDLQLKQYNCCERNAEIAPEINFALAASLL